jgi:hypothetical protein
VRPAALPLLRALPHRVERLLHVERGRALDAHGRVAPVAALALRLADPLVADADTAGDAERGVDDEQLAMVARDEAEPGAEAGWAEHAVLHACLFERGEKARLDAAHPDPVGEQPHVDAAFGGDHERRADPLADLVGTKDVCLEHDRIPRTLDRLDHRVERGGAVVEQHDVVAAGDVGGGDAPEPARERRAGRRIGAAPFDGRGRDLRGGDSGGVGHA